MGFYKGTPDIIIRNGTIVDGTGNLPYYGDLAIKGDKIEYIGNLKDVKAPLEIDAAGKYVTPGFIDCHTHSDMTIWGNPEAQSAVRQGVTTEIVGNCGFSMRNHMTGVKWDDKGKEIECAYNHPKGPYKKGDLAKTLDKMEAMGASINTAWLCGHNDIRIMADLFTKDYTPEQFNVMADYVREAMEAGYIGFSTGLEFVPGIVSGPEEVQALAAIAAEYDGIYTTHMRDEGTYIIEAINEFLDVVRKTGIRGQISHLNVKYNNGIPNEYLEKGMNMLKEAREKEHLNVYCDMLPTCFATGGAMALLPPWLYEKGWDEAKKIMATKEGREKIKADFCRYWRFLDAGEWDRLLYIQPDYLPEYCKKPFNELVKESGKTPFDFFIDVMMQAPTLDDANGVNIQGTVFYEQTMIDSVVRDPIYMWMTDSTATVEEGPLAKNTTNVQHYMSMTYFFAHYVRDAKAISIEKALPKVSSIPAKHFKLEKRGVLTEGNYADINIFDLNSLKINASFVDVNRYSSGMDYVIVNGVPVIAKGKHTMERAGRVLRHNDQTV